jgi:hypothetical protein
MLLLLTRCVIIGNYSAFKNLMTCVYGLSVFNLSYSPGFNPSKYFIIPGLQTVFLTEFVAVFIIYVPSFILAETSHEY